MGGAHGWPEGEGKAGRVLFVSRLLCRACSRAGLPPEAQSLQSGLPTSVKSASMQSPLLRPPTVPSWDSSPPLPHFTGRKLGDLCLGQVGEWGEGVHLRFLPVPEGSTCSLLEALDRLKGFGEKTASGEADPGTCFLPGLCSWRERPGRQKGLPDSGRMNPGLGRRLQERQAAT